MAVNLIKSTTLSGDKNILIAPELAFTIGCQVTNTGVVADSNGKKIIPAGTPIGGSTSVLTNRQTVLVVTNATADGANAQGVILHDTDVTAGATTATIVLAGYVDLNKIPTLNSTVSLSKITFLKGE